MLAAIGEFEREMIRARVKAGWTASSEPGGRARPSAALGAPVAVRHEVLQLLEAGRSYRATAAAAGVGLSTVQRIVKERRAGAGA